MNPNTTQKKLQHLFAQNRLKQVFERLEQELPAEGTSYHSLLMIKRRFNDLQDQKMAGTIEFRDAKLETNQIGTVLLELISRLENPDLEAVSPSRYAQIAHPIGVFTQPGNQEKLADFFQQLNFTNVRIQTDGVGMNTDLNDCDLLIFDNRDLPVCYNRKNFEELEANTKAKVSGRIELMETVLRHTPKFIIHYGDILFWINQNRARVHAANSQFSLYARTKEMIEFISSYRA